MSNHPPLPRRALGDTFRQLREARGWSITRAAQEFGVSRDKIRKLEQTNTKVSLLEIAGICKKYGASDELERELIALAEATERHSWTERYADGIPRYAQKFVALEQRAKTMLIYEPELITGLLQTDDYLRSIQERNQRISAGQAERIREARRARRERFGRLDVPPRTTVILNEHAIRRNVGGHEVMSVQLKHLVGQARLTYMTVVVLPFSAGAHPSMGTPYILLDFEGDEPEVMYSETLNACRYEDDPTAVALYRQCFEETLKHCVLLEEFINGTVAQVKP